MLRIGELYSVIAKKFGVTKQTVSYLAVKHGLKRKSRLSKNELTIRNKQIIEMLQNGELHSVIAEKFGVSKTTVSELAVKHGVRRKTRTPRLTKKELLERNLQIVEMLRNGEVHRVITEKFRVSNATVSYLAVKNGLRRTSRLSKNKH